MQADGVEGIIAVSLAPQSSRGTVGPYLRQTEHAMRELNFAVPISWTRSLHNHPLLVEAFCEKLRPLLPAGMVVFTAHSLPIQVIEDVDRYDEEARGTARAVAERTGLDRWKFAYQSQGMTGGEWLGPTVESQLEACHREGIRDVVVAPIGFVADHLEILYDVDVQFTGYARRRGLRLRRIESLNDSPTFIAALAEVVREKLEAN